MNQKALFYDVFGGGFAEHGAENATIHVLDYLKGITESLNESAAEQYANGELVGSVKSAAKITGELRTTGRDPVLEELVGLEIQTDVGTARTLGQTGKRVDIHYQYRERDAEGVESVVKVWLLNVEVGKPTRSHETKTNSVTLGEYTYPYTAFGVKLKAAEGEDNYVDDKGLERLIHDVESRPSDTNYADFFKTVPAPRYKANA